MFGMYGYPGDYRPSRPDTEQCRNRSPGFTHVLDGYGHCKECGQPAYHVSVTKAGHQYEPPPEPLEKVKGLTDKEFAYLREQEFEFSTPGHPSGKTKFTDEEIKSIAFLTMIARELDP